MSPVRFEIAENDARLRLALRPHRWAVIGGVTACSGFGAVLGAVALARQEWFVFGIGVFLLGWGAYFAVGQYRRGRRRPVHVTVRPGGLSVGFTDQSEIRLEWANPRLKIRMWDYRGIRFNGLDRVPCSLEAEGITVGLSQEAFELVVATASAEGARVKEHARTPFGRVVFVGDWPRVVDAPPPFSSSRP
ncbi:MAG: hypothetical protein ACREDK_03325 [Thermoplasmata archaeon]